MYIPLFHQPYSGIQLPSTINYVPLTAHVRPVCEHQVSWIVTDVIPQPNKPPPQLHVGSHIDMLDSERFQMNARVIRRKGVLTDIFAMEQGYIVYILTAHERGFPDIYGSHHARSQVAIPHNLVHLNPITALQYCFSSKQLHQSIGQTTHKGVICPPRRSFAESPYYKGRRNRRTWTWCRLGRT